MIGGTLKLFAMLSQRMHWLGDRQSLLAQNVANANTPGYRPVDLQELEFKDHMISNRRAFESMRTVHDDHILARAEESPFAASRKQKSVGTSISGNQVDLEAELRKVSETGVSYQTMAALYEKHRGMFKTALGRPGG